MGDTNVALALALEGTSTSASAEIDRLVGVADMLRDLPDPFIDPRFVAKLEARLMAEPIEAPAPALRLVTDEAEPVAAPVREALPANVIAMPRRRFVVRKALVAAIAAAMLMALPIIASAHTMPGNPLFRIEQFRQNVAMSHAHGMAKVLVTEKIARKWYGYGIQMTALGYPEDRVSDVFAQAGRLQARATKLVLSVGTPTQIAALRDMIQADVKWLEESATKLGDGSHPVLLDAIKAAAGHANLLGKALGLPSSISASVSAPVSSSTSESSYSASGTSDVSGGSSSAGGGTTPGGGTSDPGPKAPGTPQDPQRPACQIIGHQQLGDTLTGASKLVCAAQHTTKAR